MLLLRRWYLKFLYRDRSRNCLADSHLILLKSARRCAHDLSHAVDLIQPSCRLGELFEDRARYWLQIFSPTGVKDYRLEIYNKIDQLEAEVMALRAELASHGIQSAVPPKEPF